MNFGKYRVFTASAFVQDEDFIRWVKSPREKDKLFWNAFLLHYPGKQQVIEEAKAVVTALLEAPLTPGLTRKEKMEMFRYMQQQLHRKPVRQRKYRPALHSNRQWLLAAAAATVLLIGVAVWIFGNAEPVTGSMKTLTTGYGEQQSVELPDGSRVKLNAHSSLSFEEDWEEQGSRKVWLKGEAFFEVEEKEETAQKFLVITEDLTVEVLGTVFNVNSHQEKTKVFLEEGKVKLSLIGLEEAMLMDPGELVTYSKKKKEKPAKQRVLPILHTSWKDGFQSFDKTPLKEVLEKVEEIYGVTIQVKDSIHYDRKITTGLPVENLEEALTILELTLELQISEDKDTYIIQ